MTQHDQSKPQESLNIVIVGHVDHGKSTLVGRLYADTGSLPEGKLEKVQAICRQQGKEFEYAFLFDAFLEEQEQGITIDTARTFFIWNGRQYIIIDAPGHKEFLKNMISGAARAEAALMLKLADYPALLTRAAADLAPHDVAFYLRELSGSFHSYYAAERFLVADDATLTQARCALLTATRQVLANGLAILGVGAPEQM